MACSPVELDALLGHVDLLIFEPMRVGGITGSLKVAAMAEAAGVPVAVHTYPDLAAHLMLAAPNGMTAEYLSWWEGMFSQPIACTGASAMPLDEPGIGFTFDPDALRRHGIPSA
jgi:mandelate racemase